MFNPYYSAPAVGIIIPVLAVLGLILGIVLLVVFLPARNRARYTGGAKWLYDFLNFNKYWLSSIIKVLYIAATVVCVLGGFICLFIQPLTGLAMIVSAVVVRLVYELIMVLLSIRENTAQLNDNILRMSGAPQPPQNLGFTPPVPPAAPSPAPASPAAPAASAETNAPAPIHCTSCGTANAPGSAFCIKCGAKL
jgi:hypothetical protein